MITLLTIFVLNLVTINVPSDANIVINVIEPCTFGAWSVEGRKWVFRCSDKIADFNQTAETDPNIFDPNTWTEPNKPPVNVPPEFQTLFDGWLNPYTLKDFAQRAAVYEANEVM